ncbi:MAG: LamG domain-containing protein [Actinobacteria bacterium]|nr:LamG domain-containing protein [Actinomycetota bacterium]
MKKILALLLAFSLLASDSFAAGEQIVYRKAKWLGINPRINPDLLSDDEAIDASNITLDETGAFQDRDVFGQYNNSSGVLGSNTITGLFKFYTTTSKYFIACAGSKVALGSSGAFSTDITPTTNTVTSGTFWSASTFNNIEYMFNSSVPMMKYDAVKSVLYPAPSTPTTNCAYSAIHKARLWAARSDSLPYRLYYSSLNNGDDWTTTGGYINLPDLTQTITGLVSWGGYLFIFTETYIYRLLGSTPNDFSLQKTNSSVGAIAPRSIEVSDIGILFLSRTGCFSFDGNTSHKLSDKVEPIINDISKTNIQNACAIFDGQSKYWLSYTHKNASYNNKILIYDTILKEWYPYDNLNINYFERAYGGTDRGELYGGSSTSNGIVWLLQSASGTESVTHSTESDFLNNTTFNSVVLSDPKVVLNKVEDTLSSSATKLLCHFNGVDAASAYTSDDNNARTVTFVGNAQLDNAQYKFGNGRQGYTSLFLDGTGDYVTIPDSADWDFGTGDFTIDCWLRFSSIAGNIRIVSHDNTAVAENGDWLIQYRQGDGVLRFTWYDGGWTTADSTWSPSVNTWYHMAIVRTGNTLKFFIDGTQLGADKSITSDITRAGIIELYIGASNTPDQYFGGYLDEVHILKGEARWTTNFTAPVYEYPYFTSSGTMTSPNIQINAAETAALDTISWIGTYPSNTKVTFQTRSGATNDSVYFNNWQVWTSANTVTFNTVTDATVTFISSDSNNLKVQKPSSAQTRNILFYEDEDNISPNCAQFQAFGAVSTNKYVEAFIPTTNLSTYDWLSGWYKSPATGNSVEFYFGEGVSSDNYVTFNTVQKNTWEKWYWYIGEITSTNRDNVNYIKVRYKGDVSGNIILGETNAYNFYDSGDTMTSSPNDWLQYRAILGTNNSSQTPQLALVTLIYTPASGTNEAALSSYYHTKWLTFGTPQINKQFTDFFVDVFTDKDSALENFYFDYDIDNGARTGTITIASSNTVTDNSVKVRKYFPSSVYGKTLQLKYRNPNAKTSKHTIRAVEIRAKTEPVN